MLATAGSANWIINQRGFTLIEILVAMLLLSLGVLGLIGMQSLALKNNLSAYHRSQATILAYDLADKMRANPAGVAANHYQLALPDGVEHAGACVSYSGAIVGGCNAQKIAERDVFEWQLRISELLPGGAGVLVSNAGIQTVTINWDDDRDGVTVQNFPFSFEL